MLELSIFLCFFFRLCLLHGWNFDFVIRAGETCWWCCCLWIFGLCIDLFLINMCKSVFKVLFFTVFFLYCEGFLPYAIGCGTVAHIPFVPFSMDWADQEEHSGS